jgi:hypothetical protein
MKGIFCLVLRNSVNTLPKGDCTNGGISSRHDSLILVGDGVEKVFEENDQHPAIRLIKRKAGGREFWIAAPLDAKHGEGENGGWPYMFGGNWLYSGDSQFPSDAPIKIFDRLE